MYRYLQKCLYRGLCPKLSTNIRDKGNKLDNLEENVTYANTDENDDKNKYLFRRRKSTIFRE